MVNHKRKQEADDSDVKRLCRTIGTMMQQMTATNAALQNQSALLNHVQYNSVLQDAPEAVAPAPDSHYSASVAGPSVAGPSSGPSLPLAQPQPNQADYQEDLEDEEEDQGYFLFSLAQKYDLTWAIKGDAPLAQSELGRPSHQSTKCS